MSISPSPSNVNKILGWRVPACAKEVRQFLGMATYYRRFIKDFAKIAKPLSTLTSKCATFSWNEKCQESFETLKNALTGSEIMAYPLSNGLFILDADACRVGVNSIPELELRLNSNSGIGIGIGIVIGGIENGIGIENPGIGIGIENWNWIICNCYRSNN